MNKNQFLAFVFASFLLVFIGVFATSKTAVTENFEDNTVKVTDFFSYYISADIFRKGQPEKIYDIPLQEEYQAQITKTRIDEVLPYIYMPQSLFFFIPLAGFSMDDAYHIWNGFSIICTILLLYLLFLAGICQSPISIIVAGALIALAQPVAEAIGHGQPIITMTAALFASFLLARNKKFWAASALIIICSFKTQMMAIPALYLLIIHGKKMWVSMISIGLAVIAICALVFGVSIWQTYIDTLLHAPYTLNAFEPSHLLMASVRPLLLSIFGAEHFEIINKIGIIIWLFSFGLATFVAILSRNQSTKVQELGFSLIVVIACVFSPYLFTLSLTFLIIPIGYLLKYSGKTALYIVAIADFALGEQAWLLPKLNPYTWVFAQFCLLCWLANLLIEARGYKECATTQYTQK